MKQQKYFSFHNPSDWNSGASVHLDSYQHGLQILREHQYRNGRKQPLPESYNELKWVDAVITINGRWFWLDDQDRIWRMEINLLGLELILSLNKPPEGYQAHRIAVHDEVFVVLYQAIDEEHAHSLLCCYFLDSGQLKWSIDSYKDRPFLASSILILEDETTIALGVVDSAEHAVLIQFDHIGLAMNEAEVYRCSSSIVKEQLEHRDKWSDLTRLLLHPTGHVIFLDRNHNQIVTWDRQQMTYLQLDQEVSDVISLTVEEHGRYWVLCNHSIDEYVTLIAFDADGRVVEYGQTSMDKGQYLLARGSQLQVIDVYDKISYTLAPQLLPKLWEHNQSYSGMWLSMPLDSGDQGTQWHKVVVDRLIQHDTSITIRAFATDQLEVNLYGNKVNLVNWLLTEDEPLEQKLDALEPLWQQVILDAEDALLSGMVGQYLWLCIELVGTDNHSPILHALDVYFPRQSYVSELPNIYQRTDQGFLTNYLSIFQTLIEQTDKYITTAPKMLEASVSSGSSLKWLLGWLGIESEDFWSEEQLRELLKHAPKLANMRGTRYAIETLVRIYTGYAPIILEYDDIKPLKENIELRDVVDRLYATEMSAFNVLVKADVVDTELKRITLQHIIDKYKPVFAEGKLVVLQAWVYMDLHSYLGMNTILTAPQQLLLDGISSMPHHTITMEQGQDNQLDRHSRLGLNSRLE